MAYILRYVILLMVFNGVFSGSEEDEISYPVAILLKFTFVSNGALVRKDWVLTDANSIYGMHRIKKLLRVRIGSENYKKGGVAVPVKTIEYHPYARLHKVEYDLALLQLPPYELPAAVRPVALLKKETNVTAAHLTVVSWLREYSSNTTLPSPLEVQLMRRRRVAQLHPYARAHCTKYARTAGVQHADHLMCLDPGMKVAHHSGAPVTLNNVLWGVITSWTPEKRPVGHEPPLIANQISAKAILGWIYATIRRTFWDPKRSQDFVLYDSESSSREADEFSFGYKVHGAAGGGVHKVESPLNASSVTYKDEELDGNGLNLPD